MASAGSPCENAAWPGRQLTILLPAPILARKAWGSKGSFGSAVFRMGTISPSLLGLPTDILSWLCPRAQLTWKDSNSLLASVGKSGSEQNDTDRARTVPHDGASTTGASGGW